jgi:hypothetical protein
MNKIILRHHIIHHEAIKMAEVLNSEEANL